MFKSDVLIGYIKSVYIDDTHRTFKIRKNGRQHTEIKGS